MITLYAANQGMLVRRDTADTIDNAVLWIDMLNPTRAEDAMVEEALGLSIPTREEAQEIEASSRLYSEDNAYFMNAVTLHQADVTHAGSGINAAASAPPIAATTPLRDLPLPRTSPVTFILTERILITVRYEDLRAFSIFQSRAQKKDASCHSPLAVLVSLIESLIDRESDRIERVMSDVDKLGHGIFGARSGSTSRSRRFDVVIKHIGREAELISREQESLHSLDRVVTYIANIASDEERDRTQRARLKTASRDIDSLVHACDALNQKIQFLLDATLGLVSIEQNNVMKLFSIFSVSLLPPTLVGAIYGMNFKHIPELEWAWGYPMAIVIMILSGALPYLYCRKKGWL